MEDEVETEDQDQGDDDVVIIGEILIPLYCVYMGWKSDMLADNEKDGTKILIPLYWVYMGWKSDMLADNEKDGIISHLSLKYYKLGSIF